MANSVAAVFYDPDNKLPPTLSRADVVSGDQKLAWVKVPWSQITSLRHYRHQKLVSLHIYYDDHGTQQGPSRLSAYEFAGMTYDAATPDEPEVLSIDYYYLSPYSGWRDRWVAAKDAQSGVGGTSLVMAQGLAEATTAGQETGLMEMETNNDIVVAADAVDTSG